MTNIHKLAVLHSDTENSSKFIMSLTYAGYKPDLYFKSAQEAIDNYCSFSPYILICYENNPNLESLLADFYNFAYEKTVPIIYAGDKLHVEKLDEFSEGVHSFLHLPMTTGELKLNLKTSLNSINKEKANEIHKTKLQLAIQILELLNQTNGFRNIISDILFIVKEYTGYDEVAIRIFDEEQIFSYFESVNPNDTLSKNCSLINVKNDESSLSSEKCKGCICEIVLKHPDTLRGYPFLTYGGSFWTNDLFKTVSEYGDVFKKIGMEEFDLNGKYNSIALIPLRSQDKMIGAMLICSESKDTFKEETIRFFERISVSIGITIANKEIKEKLEENERILSKSQKIAKIGSWVNKTGSKLYYLSDEGMSILGTENRVITIDDLLAVTHPDDRNKMNEKRAAGRETMSPYSYDVRFVDQKGELRYINVSAEPVYSDGVCVEFNGILQDITERTKVLLELEENKLFLDSILTGIQAAIVIADPEQKIVVYANSTAKKLLKADDDSLTGKSYDNFISGAEEQEETHSDYIITLQDNTLIPVVRSVLHVKWKGKLHYAIIFFDLTDRKILERQLAIAQKMESIGQLAAGIAHEINTPVQYIGDNTHFIKDVMEQFLDFYTAFEKLKILAEEEGVGEKTFELLKNMEKLIEIDFVKEEVPLAIDQTLEGVERVSTIVRAMKMFSHPGSDEQTIIDINTSVKNTVTVARNEWKYVADIVMDLDETNPKILGQPVDFNQVLLNLLVNAAHAIEDVNKGTDKKGTITITTSTEKDNAVVKIKDTGSGIPANIANKIFDPFFTTKEVGKGTGQGLSICHTVIRDKYGGQIYFDTVEKEGTTFIIKLKKIDT